VPRYQYACTEPACGHEFEVVQSFSDPTLTTCPACEGRLRKVFSAVGVVFKGSGFYRNDSRADTGKKASASKESTSTSVSGSDSSSSSSTSSSDSGSTSSGSSSSSGGSSNGSSSGSSGSPSGSSSGGTNSTSSPSKAAAAS
jgi:putative FmdB family regulatory protein